MAMLGWLIGLALIWSCYHYNHVHSLDRLALNLFDNGRDEAVFLIPVGSGEPFHRQLATNSRTDQLVTGSVRSIEVTLNGGYDDDDLERIAINKDRAAVIITIIGNLYRYVLSGSPATTNYSILLSSLAYVSNLNSDSLAESPRNITITAYGGNSSSVTAVANIMLVPANLEAPVFQFNPIEVNLAENAMTGSLVTTINASDPEGHPVTFSFNESSPLFNISSSGQVIVLDLAALDYENKAHRIFNLVVIAMDNDPISRRSSSATLTVSLYNLNDNPPIFTQPIYTFSVVEEAAGAIVGVILATDADGANLNALRYDFLPADTGLTFSLNRVTGEISVRLALDYEDRTNYTFQVTATDSSFTSSTEVVVNVVDVADNRPVITPFQNTIIVDLDTENNGIALHEGTDGPLIVHDDSAILVSGYANITVLRSGILETFPNEYGVCKCTNSVCFDVFALCGTSSNNSLQQDLFSGVTTASSAGPALVSGLNFQVYTFNGRNDLSNNWLEIPSIVKTQFLQRTDNFTVSFWIRIPIGSGSSYILTFELGRSRYFSLYESSAQTLVLYYFRDNIPGFVNDDGRDTQVALTFFYDTAVLPSGLRDNQWHFVTLSVDFPSVVLNVDGYVHRPTRGSYRNQFDSRVDLVLLTDGNSYNLPAPILTKSQTQIDAISGKIGGSARGNQFSLGGQIRQITLTDLFDENTVSCLASCNNRIGIAPSASVSSSISTLYNPVARALYFSGAASPSQYTTLLQSLVYYSNGFLPPEELGEIHVISISISDEVDFGSIAQISVVGRSNQHDPVLDSNGDSVDGVDFQVDFHENDMHQVSIVSPQVFISDDDIGSRLVWLTATIVNPQLSNADELLSLVNNPPSALNVSGVNTYSINFTAVDSFQATANIFITALLDVRYSNFANEPVGVNRIIRLTVSDGLRTGSAITTVHILTVNDPPVLLFSGSTTTGLHTTVQYNESSTPIHLVPSLILVDPDSLHMVEAHVWIEQVFDEGNESIAFVSSLLPSEVSCSPFSCNGTDIRITGISAQHHYQALLRTLRYVNVQQFADFPNLSDRVVYITVSDGETSSDPMFHVLIDFIPINPHTILELAAPDQNFTTSFMKGQAEPIKCYGLVRVVDPSIVTFDSVIVTIRDNLPEGVSERDELTITTSTLEDISVEINTILKRITFSTVASTDQYIAAIQQIRYFNPEIKPYPINRFVDFLIVPGRDAPNDHAHCEITITNNSANSSMSVNVFQTEVDQPSRTVTLSSQTTAVFTELSTQPTETPDLSVNVFQTELSDRPSRTVTLSDQTTVVFIGLSTQPTQTLNLSVNLFQTELSDQSSGTVTFSGLSTQPTKTPDLSANLFQTELSYQPSRTVTFSGLLIQPTKTPDSSMKVFQTELSDQPSGTVTLSGQTTAVFTGPELSAQPTETPDLPTNALVIIVLGIFLFVAGIVIFGLVGTTIIVYKRKSRPQQTAHTVIQDQAIVYTNTGPVSILTHQNPSYSMHQEVNGEPHEYETLSLYEIPSEFAQVNANPAVVSEWTTQRWESNSNHVSNLDEGTGNTYVSIHDNTGDSYVTIQN